MDSFYNESNKLNVQSSISKLMIPARSRSNNYSTPENLIKYLRFTSLSNSGNSSSPAKSGFRSSGSPQPEKTPVKMVEEDTLVMDAVLVDSDTNIVGSGSSFSSSGSAGFHKSDICRTWEEFGHCRYGSKCQFAHGKEEVRPICFTSRNKSEVSIIDKIVSEILNVLHEDDCGFEALMYKSFASSIPSPHSSFLRETSTKAEHRSQRSSSPIKPEKTINSILSLQAENTPRLTTNFTMKPKANKTRSTSTIKPAVIDFVSTFTNGTDWSPLDDGIDAAIPSRPGKTPSRADLDAYINNVLYGPTSRKRLPLFSAIYPDE